MIAEAGVGAAAVLSLDKHVTPDGLPEIPSMRALNCKKLPIGCPFSRTFKRQPAVALQRSEMSSVRWLMALPPSNENPKSV